MIDFFSLRHQRSSHLADRGEKISYPLLVTRRHGWNGETGASVRTRAILGVFGAVKPLTFDEPTAPARGRGRRASGQGRIMHAHGRTNAAGTGAKPFDGPNSTTRRRPLFGPRWSLTVP
jgi:hypothetical protein